MEPSSVSTADAHGFSSICFIRSFGCFKIVRKSCCPMVLWSLLNFLLTCLKATRVLKFSRVTKSYMTSSLSNEEVGNYVVLSTLISGLLFVSCYPCLCLILECVFYLCLFYQSNIRNILRNMIFLILLFIMSPLFARFFMCM